MASTSTSRKTAMLVASSQHGTRHCVKFDVRHIDDGYNSPIRSYEHIIPLGRLADELNDEITF
jgi:hypothetical protein